MWNIAMRFLDVIAMAAVVCLTFIVMLPSLAVRGLRAAFKAAELRAYGGDEEARSKARYKL